MITASEAKRESQKHTTTFRAHTPADGEVHWVVVEALIFTAAKRGLRALEFGQALPVEVTDALLDSGYELIVNSNSTIVMW